MHKPVPLLADVKSAMSCEYIYIGNIQTAKVCFRLRFRTVFSWPLLSAYIIIWYFITYRQTWKPLFILPPSFRNMRFRFRWSQRQRTTIISPCLTNSTHHQRLTPTYHRNWFFCLPFWIKNYLISSNNGSEKASVNTEWHRQIKSELIQNEPQLEKTYLLSCVPS